jgi:hypothetical protein
MKEVEHKGFTQVIYETDLTNVVDDIHKLRVDNSEFNSIICNIRNVLCLNPNFMVKFIKHQTNIVAHTLAKAATV